eukprot:700397-Pelagomonas_calceolata.AAC.6
MCQWPSWACSAGENLARMYALVTNLGLPNIRSGGFDSGAFVTNLGPLNKRSGGPVSDALVTNLGLLNIRSGGRQHNAVLHEADADDAGRA